MSTPNLRRSTTRAGLTLALLGLLSGCTRGCGTATPASGPLAYVSDEEGGSVVVVDPSTARVVARIAVGKRPRGLALSRDGQRLYVALSGSPRGGPGVDESKLPPPDRSADGIAVVDTAARKLVRMLPGGQNPESVALSRDNQTLYVSNQDTATLTFVDVDTGAIRGRVPVGGQPAGVTVRADGFVVFVTSTAEHQVVAIDAVTHQQIAKMPTGPRPRSVIVSQDGGTAFVTDEQGHDLTLFDANSYRALGRIELHEDSPMPAGVQPVGGVISPDGKQLYVTCGRGGSVAVVDVATRKQVRSIDGVGDRPWGIAIDAAGTRLYTANGTSHDLSIVNLATGNVDRRVAIGGLPWGVVLSRQP